MEKKRFSILLLVLCLSFPISIFADTIILKSGDKIEGKILEHTDKKVVIDQFGVEVPYFIDEIESVNLEPVKDVVSEKVGISSQINSGLQNSAELPKTQDNQANKKGSLVEVGDANLAYASYFFVLPQNWLPDIDNNLFAMTRQKGFWRGKHRDSQAWIYIAPTKTNGENSEFINTSKNMKALSGCSLNNYNFIPSFTYPYEVYLEHCPKTGVGNRCGLIIFAKLPKHVIQFNLYAIGEHENCLIPFLEDFNKVIASFRWTLGLSDDEVGNKLKEFQQSQTY